MRPRHPARLLAAGLAAALLAGCATDDGPRRAGDPVTPEEAHLLAMLLHRNFQKGGADFVVTAPYSGAVLTLTGEVDFRESVGHAEALTTFADDRADDVRTLFFTPEDLWVGDLPGLTEALARDGAADAGYLRRPLADGADGGPPLADLLVEVLLHLSSESADDAQAFLTGGYTWQGQRSIDSRLASLFDLHLGTVAVGAGDDLLMQYAAPVAGGAVDVTVTLSEHGRRHVDLPAEAETALVADHPGVAAALGI
jgi:hypothetical protein